MSHKLRAEVHETMDKLTPSFPLEAAAEIVHLTLNLNLWPRADLSDLQTALA